MNFYRGTTGKFRGGGEVSSFSGTGELFTGGLGDPKKIFGKISVKLRIFRALKTVITPLIIGKSPKIDA